MSRLIDAEPLEKRLPPRVAEIVKLAPTVDAVEVKHGHWMDSQGRVEFTGDHGAMCSVCGEYTEDNSEYCGRCGAKMDDELQRKKDSEWPIGGGRL